MAVVLDGGDWKTGVLNCGVVFGGGLRFAGSVFAFFGGHGGYRDECNQAFSEVGGAGQEAGKAGCFGGGGIGRAVGRGLGGR